MKLSFGDSLVPCRNCGHEYPAGRLDRRLWCSDCRTEVVRRASFVARLIAILVALGLVGWIFYLVGSSPRFLIVYVVMVIAAYLFMFKLTQRVAFEVIRSRGVPPSTPESDG